jgi:hypothetical protein
VNNFLSIPSSSFVGERFSFDTLILRAGRIPRSSGNVKKIAMF